MIEAGLTPPDIFDNLPVNAIIIGEYNEDSKSN
jgi:hypothetical protein